MNLPDHFQSEQQRQPNHSGVTEEDTEFLEIAPQHLHQKFLTNARRNLEAMQRA